MTIFLVATTIAAFVLVEWYLVTRRRRVADEARAAISLATSDARGITAKLFLHPGHTWVRVHGDDLVSVGATDFASNFAGSLSAIELPAEGSRLLQGQPAWTLVSSRDRRLAQTVPVEGKVLAVNRELLRNPRLAQHAPYEAGWILRIRPRHLRRSLRNLLPGSTAGAWLDAIRTRVASRLSPALGALAHDGGEWAPHFGDRLGDAEWEALRAELFPAAPGDQAQAG